MLNNSRSDNNDETSAGRTTIPDLGVASIHENLWDGKADKFCKYWHMSVSAVGCNIWWKAWQRYIITFRSTVGLCIFILCFPRSASRSQYYIWTLFLLPDLSTCSSTSFLVRHSQTFLSLCLQCCNHPALCRNFKNSLDSSRPPPPLLSSSAVRLSVRQFVQALPLLKRGQTGT